MLVFLLVGGFASLLLLRIDLFGGVGDWLQGLL